MKHGYRHLQGVRLCEIPGCMLKWPCERHGTQVAWSTPSPFPRAVKVRSQDNPAGDVTKGQAMEYVLPSLGTVNDKKCAKCGYHVCGCRPLFPRAPNPIQSWAESVIFQRTSPKRP